MTGNSDAKPAGLLRRPRTASSGEWKWRALSLLVLLATWSFASFLAGSETLPSPWLVAREIVARLAAEMPGHIAVTLLRSMIAFLAAMFIGALAGIVMGRHRTLDRFFDTWLVAGLNMPALVVIILFYVWFGLNEFAAIAAVVVNKAPVVAAIVREGARAVRKDLLDVGTAFHLSRRRILWRIYLPQLWSHLAAAAHTVFALTWKIVLVVELLGRPDGVGFQLRRFFNFFDITAILAYTVAFVMVVLLVETTLLQPLERHANRWRSA